MRLALVTGGHRRLGGHISARLASDGWTLAIHGARDATPDDDLAIRLGDWHGFVANLSEADAVAKLLPAVIAHFGAPPSLLVNNASMFEWDDAASATTAGLTAHHAVNTHAPVALALAMAQAGADGSIVNILGGIGRHDANAGRQSRAAPASQCRRTGADAADSGL
jgi:pteridine reductase